MLLNFYQRTQRAWLASLLLAGLLLSSCAAEQNQYLVETPDGKASMGNITQTKYLIGTDHAQAAIAYRAPASTVIKAPVDILILFDRTGSMQEVISTTASAAAGIVSDIQKDAPNTRFAVASVCDYSPLFTPSQDTRTWLLHSDFTLDASTVAKASGEITLSDGGDIPEAYSRGFYEAAALAWRPEAKKIIIFFGDATDHPVDPGRDETLGTADDLTMSSVLTQLKAQGISVIAIHTRNDAEVIQQFNTISQATQGTTVPLDNAESSSQVIKASIKGALSKPASLTAVGDQADWISTRVDDSAGRSELDYQLNIKVPPNTPAGVYPIQLLLSSENADDSFAQAFKQKPFTIKVITGWYNHPLALWLPVLVFLAYLVWCSLRMLRGGYKHSISVTSNAQFDANRYTLSYLLLDLLALTSAISVLTALYLCWNGLVLSQLLNALFN
jgi:hypothetical protein